MTDGNSIVNFGDLTKPATVLIEKISNAIGILFEPKRMRRNAEAKAKVAKNQEFYEYAIAKLFEQGICLSSILPNQK